MKKTLWKLRRGSAAMLLSAAFLCQLGGCDFGTIDISTTVDARTFIVSLVRSFVLDPIEGAVDDALANVFDGGN